jgi:hypothetical protein
MVKKKGEPTELNATIVGSWLGAAQKRPPTRRLMAVEKFLKLQNPVRVWRMKRDLKWARKCLAKAGYDPEEIRWIW